MKIINKILYVILFCLLISNIFANENIIKEKPEVFRNTVMIVREYSYAQSDSLQLKMYKADREYFLKLQETVLSKNQYIGLQWCIDLLNKYIEIEERKLNPENK